MNFLINLPIEARLAILFCLGVLVGTQLNRGIYRWAIRHKRLISPWSPPPENAPPRRWFDRVPILGWWGLRRESAIHGRGHWVRPMAIELLTGAGFAALYWWEIKGGLLPPVGAIGPDLLAQLHANYLSHVVLISLMIVATFIDVDEKTIPDEVTVTGVLVLLGLAALTPTSLLPDPTPIFPAGFAIRFLKLPWAAWLDGPQGLLCGLACFWGWCYAILPKLWWTRKGLGTAFKYLVASIPRYSASWKILVMGLLGSLAIVGVWWCGETWWQGLLTALVGMAFGGGLIWAVRVIGTVVLGREAMGFGDVTLMAMIGAYVGWQASLFVFFLAPLAGLVLALTQWILTGRRDIPYGPFLCLATLVTIVFWAPIWDYFREIFTVLGWLVPGLVGFCLILMAGMLKIWRLISEAIFRSE